MFKKILQTTVLAAALCFAAQSQVQASKMGTPKAIAECTDMCKAQRDALNQGISEHISDPNATFATDLCKKVTGANKGACDQAAAKYLSATRATLDSPEALYKACTALCPYYQ
jgi:hypothetical protein